MKTDNYEYETAADEIIRNAPPDEPARQFFFMEQVRKILKSEFEKKVASGQAVKQYGEEKLADMISRSIFGLCAVVTFGCQMNARDSEKLLGILDQVGFAQTDREEDADFILYNTCTVRENANQRVYGRLGYLKTLKKAKPHLMIGLCGCMMQEPAVVEKLKKSYRFVDIIFGTHNIFMLAELIYRRVAEKKPVVDIWNETDRIVENLPTERKYLFKSGVNIMFGCNNFCSYCIVPYVRGRERSREPEEILEEIRRLAANGVVEIMLLGQNVNSYGKTLKTPVTFAQLLQKAEEVKGIERIRFMTSHPKDLSDELIAVMRDSKKICHHLHLPLQSGSSRILKEMNRNYTKEQYLDLVDRIRTAMPDIALTTDIIVGFPGETEEDFQETMDVVRTVRFDSAFTFLYSKRTGTPAAKIEDQILPEVAKDRFDRLLHEVQRISAEVCGRDLHTVQKVLAEEPDDHEAGYLTGRMDNNTIVHFKGEPSLIGQIVEVSLDESKGFYYMGTLL